MKITYHLRVAYTAEEYTMQTGVDCLVRDSRELQLHWGRLERIQAMYILPVRGASLGWRSGNHMGTTRRFGRRLQ